MKYTYNELASPDFITAFRELARIPLPAGICLSILKTFKSLTAELETVKDLWSRVEERGLSPEDLAAQHATLGAKESEIEKKVIVSFKDLEGFKVTALMLAVLKDVIGDMPSDV